MNARCPGRLSLGHRTSFQTMRTPVALTVIAIVTSVACNRNAPIKEIADRQQSSAQRAFGVVSEVIALEDREDVPLGWIARVDRLQHDGSWFVSDFGATNAVYQFDRAGKFIQKHDIDPGLRDEQLNDFVVQDHALYLLTDRFLVKKPLANGAQTYVRIPPLAGRVTADGGEVCASSLIAEGPAVRCFDGNLKMTRQIFDGEVLSDKYRYVSRRPLVQTGDGVGLARLYEPRLDWHDLRSGKTTSFGLKDRRGIERRLRISGAETH